MKTKINRDLTEIIVYCPQISHGKARTRGHGKTCRVLVIRRSRTFRSLNSPHEIVRDFGTVRMDYGLLRGRSGAVLAEARNFCSMVQAPEPRTTHNEF